MQAKRRTGINPLAYLGVDPITPPMLVVEQRDPTDNDFSEYELGAIWMVSIPTKIWMMVNKDPSVSPKWVQIYPGDGSGTNFFTTDDGNTAIQVGGLLNIFGSNDVATYSTPGSNTVTVALENDVTIVSSLTLTPILSSVLTTDAVGLVVGAQGTDLQMFLGNTGATPSFYTPVSEDGSVTITAGSVPGTINFQAVGGGGGGFGGLDADTGTAVPLLNKISTLGDATNIDTSASGHTVTFTLRSILTLPQTNSAGSQGIIKLGANRFITNLGTDNTFVGDTSGNFTLTTGSATGNTGVGTGVLNDLTTSANNSALGVGALTAVAGGAGANSALGALAGGALVDGHNNVFLGATAGLNYTSESHNISISNEGVALDSGVIRIGNTTDHNHCYIGGIYGTTGGATNGVVSADTDGKLFTSNGTDGQVLIGGGTGPVWATITSSDSSIIFTPGANQLDMVAVGGGGSSGITKLGADVGTPALPLLGEVDIIGGTNINTSTAPNAVVVNLDDWISLPSTNAAGTAGGISLNSLRFMHAIGVDNTFLGSTAGNLACNATCHDNVAIGQGAMRSMAYADTNTAVGSKALYSVTGNSIISIQNNTAVGYKAMYLWNHAASAAGRNVAVGALALSAETDADNCTAIGYNALSQASFGDNNIAIGASAGTAVTGSYNICIGSSGLAGTGYNINLGTTSHTSFYVPAARTDVVGGWPLGVDMTTGQIGKSVYTLATDPQLNMIMAGGGSGVAPSWKTLRSTNGTILVDTSVAGYIDLRYASTSTCAFHAVQSGTTGAVTGDGTLYNLGTKAAFSEIYDRGGNFYPGDGTTQPAKFTAPQTGLYMFIMTVLAVGLPSAPTTTTAKDPLRIVTSNRNYALTNPVILYTFTDHQQTLTFSAIADMDVSDTAIFQFGLLTSPSGLAVGVGQGTILDPGTTISGYLIG